jgi:hypothetical protein
LIFFPLSNSLIAKSNRYVTGGFSGGLADFSSGLAEGAASWAMAGADTETNSPIRIADNNVRINIWGNSP